MEAQNIVRAGVLAFVLGVGAVVANTPAVAFAAPTTPVLLVRRLILVVDVQFVIRIRGKYVINGSGFINSFVGLSG